MKYRRFGSLGWEVSAVGFGAWAIGGDMWGPQDDAESIGHRAQFGKASLGPGAVGSGQFFDDQPAVKRLQGEFGFHIKTPGGDGNLQRRLPGENAIAGKDVRDL